MAVDSHAPSVRTDTTICVPSLGPIPCGESLRALTSVTGFGGSTCFGTRNTPSPKVNDRTPTIPQHGLAGSRLQERNFNPESPQATADNRSDQTSQTCNDKRIVHESSLLDERVNAIRISALYPCFFYVQHQGRSFKQCEGNTMIHGQEGLRASTNNKDRLAAVFETWPTA